jgi:hypothetical protein
VKDLAPDQMSWRPPAGGWTLAQVIEHIVIAADSYLTPIRRLIFRPGAPVTHPDRAEWAPTWTGAKLVNALRSARRLPTPRIHRVDGEPRPDIVRAFLGRQETTVTLMRAAADLDWNRLRFRSPVTWLIRLNLGDGFTVIVVHAQRHAQQMERIRDLPLFPKT